MNNIKKYTDFINENIDNNYLLGNVKYSWVKNEIKEVTRIEPKGTTRINILTQRKKELRLSEYQTLYDYWNFCDKNSGSFKIANNPVENYKRVINDWVWYLTIIQLFPNDLKNAVRDFYTVQYNEILSLPQLIGDLENDKIILEKAVRGFFMRPDSITRQSITGYDIRFKDLF